jgi:HSP20 family molecular chaperone IbpA
MLTSVVAGIRNVRQYPELQGARVLVTGISSDSGFDIARGFAEGFFDDASTANVFAPSVNFAETEKGYEVSVELPGMKPEDVHVEFKDGHLWITGERKSEVEEKGKTFHRVERRYGSFRRVIAIGNEVIYRAPSGAKQAKLVVSPLLSRHSAGVSFSLGF